MSYITYIFVIIMFHISVDYYCKDSARPSCYHEASDLAKNSALIATAPNNIGYRYIFEYLNVLYIDC